MSSSYSNSRHHSSSSEVDRAPIGGLGRTLSGGIQVAGQEDELPFSLPVVREQNDRGTVFGSVSMNEPAQSPRKRNAYVLGDCVLPFAPVEGDEAGVGIDRTPYSNSQFVDFNQPQPRFQRQPQQSEFAGGRSRATNGVFSSLNGREGGAQYSTKRNAAMAENLQKVRSIYSASSSSSDEEEGEVDEFGDGQHHRNGVVELSRKPQPQPKRALLRTRSSGSQQRVMRKVANFKDPRNRKSLATSLEPKPLPLRRASAPLRQHDKSKAKQRPSNATSSAQVSRDRGRKTTSTGARSVPRVSIPAKKTGDFPRKGESNNKVRRSSSLLTPVHSKSKTKGGFDREVDTIKHESVARAAKSSRKDGRGNSSRSETHHAKVPLARSSVKRKHVQGQEMSAESGSSNSRRAATSSSSSKKGKREALRRGSNTGKRKSQGNNVPEPKRAKASKAEESRARKSREECKVVELKVVCGYLCKELLEHQKDFVLEEFDRVSLLGKGKFKFVVENQKEVNVSALGKLLRVTLETKTLMTPTAKSLEWLLSCMCPENIRFFSVTPLKDKWPRTRHAYHYWVPTYIFDPDFPKTAKKEEMSTHMRNYRILEADVCRMSTCLPFPGDDFGVTQFRFGHSPVIINDVQFVFLFVFIDTTVQYTSEDLATIFGTIVRSSKTSNNGNFQKRIMEAVTQRDLYNRAPLSGLVLRSEGYFPTSDVTRQMQFEEEVFVPALIADEDRSGTFIRWWLQPQPQGRRGPSEGKGRCMSCNRHAKLNYRVRGDLCYSCIKRKALPRNERKLRRKEVKTKCDQYYQSCAKALKSLDRRQSKPRETPSRRAILPPQNVARRIEPPRAADNGSREKLEHAENTNRSRIKETSQGTDNTDVARENGGISAERRELERGVQAQARHPRPKPLSSFSLLEKASGMSVEPVAQEALRFPNVDNPESGAVAVSGGPERNGSLHRPSKDKGRVGHGVAQASLEEEEARDTSQTSDRGMEGIARQASNLLTSLTRGSSCESLSGQPNASNSQTSDRPGGGEGRQELVQSGRTAAMGGKSSGPEAHPARTLSTDRSDVLRRDDTSKDTKYPSKPAAPVSLIEMSSAKPRLQGLGDPQQTLTESSAAVSTPKASADVTSIQHLTPLYRGGSNPFRPENGRDRGTSGQSAVRDARMLRDQRFEERAASDSSARGERSLRREGTPEVAVEARKDPEKTHEATKLPPGRTDAVVAVSVKREKLRDSRAQTGLTPVTTANALNGGAVPPRLKSNSSKSSKDASKKLEELELIRLRLLYRIEEKRRAKQKMARAVSVAQSPKRSAPKSSAPSPKSSAPTAARSVPSTTSKKVPVATSASEPLPQELSVMSQDLKLTFNMNEEIQKKTENRELDVTTTKRNGASKNSVEGTIAELKGRIASREKQRTVSTLQSTLEKMKGAKKAELAVKKLEVKVRQQLIKVNVIRGRILEHENAPHQKETVVYARLPHNA